MKQLKNEITRFTVDEVQLQIDCILLEKLKDDLTKQKKLQDRLEIQKGVFECPSCNKHLKFVSEKLEVVKDVIILEKELDNSLYEEILKLNKQISMLENSISSRKNKIDRYKEVEKNISNISSNYLDDDKNLPDLNEINKDLLYMKKYITSQQDKCRELTSLKILEKHITRDMRYSQ